MQLFKRPKRRLLKANCKFHGQVQGRIQSDTTVPFRHQWFRVIELSFVKESIDPINPFTFQSSFCGWRQRYKHAWMAPWRNSEDCFRMVNVELLRNQKSIFKATNSDEHQSVEPMWISHFHWKTIIETTTVNCTQEHSIRSMKTKKKQLLLNDETMNGRQLTKSRWKNQVTWKHILKAGRSTESPKWWVWESLRSSLPRKPFDFTFHISNQTTIQCSTFSTRAKFVIAYRWNFAKFLERIEANFFAKFFPKWAFPSEIWWTNNFSK